MQGEFDDTAWQCEVCTFSKVRGQGINRPMDTNCDVCNSNAPEIVRKAQHELKRTCDATITYAQAGGKKNKRKTRRTRH